MGEKFNHRIFSNIFYTFLVFIFLATIAVCYAIQINEGDIWFHLAYGKYFLEHHVLSLDHSIFSWTPAKSDVPYCNWVSEIFFYLLYKIGGISAFFCLRYMFIFVFMLFAFSFIRKIRIEYTPAVLLILLSGLLMSFAGIRIRPELFSFLFMTIMVWTWFKIKTSPDIGHLLCYIFPVLLLAWVNSHGGFIFGVAFLGSVFAGEVINWLTGSKEMINHRTRIHLFISITLSVITCLVTPYGWEYPVRLVNELVLNSKEFTQNSQTIMEFQSIFHIWARRFHFIDYLLLFSAILVLLHILYLRRHKPDWSLIVSNLLFVTLYMKYLRTTYFWAIIIVFSSLYLLQKILQSDVELSSRKISSLLIQLALSCILVFFSARAMIESFSSSDFGFSIGYCNPITEAEYIKGNFPHVSVIGNDYNCGAYLMWSLWPEKKIFLDARYFPYSEWFSEYNEFVYGKDRAKKDSFIKKYNCSIWCVTHSFPQVGYFMNSTEWKLVYYGPSACIFVSNSLNFPRKREVSDSVYDVSFYQALYISDNALKAGDIDVAKKLIANLRPNRFSKQQQDLVKIAGFRLGKILNSNAYLCNFLAKEGEAKAKAGDIDGAIKSFAEAVRIKPDLDINHYNLGLAYLQTHRLDDAIEEFSKVLEINPQNSKARRNLDLAKQCKEKIDKNIILLQRKIKSESGNMGLIHALAISYAEKGDYESALKQLNLLLSKAPEKPDTYYNISCMYAKLNNINESIRWLDLAIQKGFADISLIKKDSDLNSIHDTMYYKQLIQEHEGLSSKGR